MPARSARALPPTLWPAAVNLSDSIAVFAGRLLVEEKPAPLPNVSTAPGSSGPAGFQTALFDHCWVLAFGGV